MANETRNRVGVDVDVSGEERARDAFKGLKADTDAFEQGVNRAAGSGMRLRDIFTGNLLADFFQRGVDAAIQFGARTIAAAAAAEDSNRVLEFSATKAGLAYTDAA
ncbi:MAG TPA: hypothetical protein VK422_18870, partial [Pyrinomonadaceae bacterium]|nr:hypothetical protein [Pyrinomonadaceae bacterium]